MQCFVFEVLALFFPCNYDMQNHQKFKLFNGRIYKSGFSSTIFAMMMASDDSKHNAGYTFASIKLIWIIERIDSVC